jgi:UDP-glucose 4-epimerase
MRCIVTGGAGFIGSHLVERLLKEEHKVIVIDDFSTGKQSNLRAVERNRDLQIIEESILMDLNRLKGVFSNTDWVFHLAGKADIVPSIKNPVEYFKVNVEGTVNVLEASRYAGVKRFIYTASSSCYGDQSSTPTRELSTINPRYPYALTKYLGELLTKHWGNLYNLSFISLRLFNVYGLRSRTSGAYGAVIGTFLKQKLENKPLTIVGDGNQSRDFTHVLDVAEAFHKAAASDHIQGVFNIGTGRPHTINYLAKLIGGEITHIPKRPGEPRTTSADNLKASNILGWKPKVKFEDGIKELVDHIEDFRDAPLWTPESIQEATKEWFQYLK